MSWKRFSSLVSRVNLATIFEGDPKALFKEGATPFPVFLDFKLDPYLIMLSVKEGGISYHFWVFGMTWPVVEPWSPGPLSNTLLIRPMVEYE